MNSYNLMYRHIAANVHVLVHRVLELNKQITCSDEKKDNNNAQMGGKA